MLPYFQCSGVFVWTGENDSNFPKKSTYIQWGKKRYCARHGKALESVTISLRDTVPIMRTREGLLNSAERELEDSRCWGMFQSCIWMSRGCFRMPRSCFGISSRYLRVLWFILSGERNNYEEVLLLEEIKKKELLFLTCPGFEPTYVWPVR